MHSISVPQKHTAMFTYAVVVSRTQAYYNSNCKRNVSSIPPLLVPFSSLFVFCPLVGQLMKLQVDCHKIWETGRLWTTEELDFVSDPKHLSGYSIIFTDSSVVK